MVHEVGLRQGLGRHGNLLSQLRLGLLSSSFCLILRRHTRGPYVHRRRRRRLLLRGQTVRDLLRH